MSAQAYEWVHKNMPAEEVQALTTFTERNPRLTGGSWWDAMDILRDADAHLDIIEPMFEEMGEEWDVIHEYVTLTLIYASSTFALAWDTEQRIQVLRTTIKEHTP